MQAVAEGRGIRAVIKILSRAGIPSHAVAGGAGVVPSQHCRDGDSCVVAEGRNVVGVDPLIAGEIKKLEIAGKTCPWLRRIAVGKAGGGNTQGRGVLPDLSLQKLEIASCRFAVGIEIASYAGVQLVCAGHRMKGEEAERRGSSIAARIHSGCSDHSSPRSVIWVSGEIGGVTRYRQKVCAGGQNRKLVPICVRCCRVVVRI